MLFSYSLTHYRCTSCRHEITRSTSTAFLYYFALLGIGLAVTLPLYERAFEPEGWERMIPIVIELATLTGSVLVWSVAYSLIRENVKTCSRCGGQFEVFGGGFNHGLVPNLEDVVIGLLFTIGQMSLEGLRLAGSLAVVAVGVGIVWRSLRR